MQIGKGQTDEFSKLQIIHQLLVISYLRCHRKHLDFMSIWFHNSFYYDEIKYSASTKSTGIFIFYGVYGMH